MLLQEEQVLKARALSRRVRELYEGTSGISAKVAFTTERLFFNKEDTYQVLDRIRAEQSSSPVPQQHPVHPPLQPNRSSARLAPDVADSTPAPFLLGQHMAFERASSAPAFGSRRPGSFNARASFNQRLPPGAEPEQRLSFAASTSVRAASPLSASVAAVTNPHLPSRRHTSHSGGGEYEVTLAWDPVTNSMLRQARPVKYKFNEGDDLVRAQQFMQDSVHHLAKAKAEIDARAPDIWQVVAARAALSGSRQGSRAGLSGTASARPWRRRASPLWAYNNPGV